MQSNLEEVKKLRYTQQNELLLMKKCTLLVCCAVAFLTPFMGSSINLAIPSIGKAFNSGAITLTWVTTSYLLATAAFLVPVWLF